MRNEFESAEKQPEHKGLLADVSRRRFLQMAGGLAGAGVVLAACGHSKSTDLYLGSGDTALLNYLYVLQQVEAAFYTQAVATPYYGLSQSESVLLTELRDQEIAHREFLKKKLGTDAISDIGTTFAAVTFADRTSVTHHQQVIEDIVSSAFNGVIRLFTDKGLMTSVTKMVSVEARHSAYARDLVAYNSFADATTVNSNGLDMATAPHVVMSSIQVYITSKFDITKLPTY